MARKKKSSPAEDMLELIGLLPWWAGVGLALLPYLLLHRAAIHVVVAPLVPGQGDSVMTQTLWKTLAIVGQYFLPLICLCGAAVSAIGRHKRRKLVAVVSGSNAADALEGMSWQEFELLVGEAFRLQGYQVTDLGGGGADGGVDLVMRKGGEKYLVQCKQWKAFTVGVTVVRELYGVMAANGAAGGFVVTSGRFTDEANQFASGRSVKLIDGPRLFALIKQATAERAVSAKAPAPPSIPAPARVVTQPPCPACAKPMVMRTAKRGSAVGNDFWGCSDFPACRGTRQVG